MIQFEATAEAGQIACEASGTDEGFTRFVVRAFQQEQALTESQLAILAGFPLSSLEATHEAGYEELGGYTIHLKLSRMRHEATGTFHSEEICVSVNKDGVSVANVRGAK